MADIVTIAPMILAVAPWDVRKAWILAGPLLAPSIALTKGAYEPDDVLRALEAREGQLWVAMTDTAMLGAVASKIVTYPRKRSLYCPFVGGDIGRLNEWWKPMFARLIEFAHVEECHRIEGAGRTGWARKLPGMEATGSLLIKEL